MSAQFTPGPWAYALDNDGSGKRACITTVAHCCDYVIGLPSDIPGGNYRDGDPSGDPEADARLIAAAPTQHAELLRYLPIIERAEADPELWARLTEGTGIATANGYRAAIARATQGH